MADGGSVVRTVDILAVGPDGAAGTPDDWTASVSGLPAVDGDHVIVYTIEEEMPSGYRLSEEPRRTDEGFALTNELVPEEAPRTSDKHVDSNGSSMPSTGDALLAGAWALVLAGAMLLLLGSLARRENRG